MNKKILVVACLVMMATVFTGCNLLGGDKNQEAIKEGNNAEQNQKNDGNEEESFFGSVQDLLTCGKSLKCVYSIDNERGKATGVIYVSGNKIRSEVEIVENAGKKMEVDSIIADNWMYTWNSLMSGGTKMNIKEMQSETGEDYSQNENEADKMREEMDYKCRPWIPDNSKFTVPSDVEFRDLTEMMQGFDIDEAEENAGEASAKLCEMCEMLTGEARNKCRADMGCE